MFNKQVVLITKNDHIANNNKEKPILIVIANDDEHLIQKTLHEVLEKQGYQILETND